MVKKYINLLSHNNIVKTTIYRYVDNDSVRKTIKANLLNKRERIE